MKPMTKRELWTLAGIILAAIVIFVVFFLGVIYPRPIVVEVPSEDEIVALGYESHLTGMFVEDFMGAEVQDTIVVTTGDVITMTGTYQPLSSAGDVVTCTLETAGALGRYTGVRDVTYTVGSLLWLVNTSSTTITVTEGSTAKMTGTSSPLGQYDDLLMFFDGTYWVELAQADN